MILEGTYTKVVTGSLIEVMHPLHYVGGWKVKEVQYKRNWPYFWEKTFTVTLKLDIIVDDKYIIETPLTDLK
jgi:hypothetical protein